VFKHILLPTGGSRLARPIGVLGDIVRAADLNDTGRGIAFVLPVEKVVGVAHFMKRA
jgi:hypothetical protein